MSTAGMQLRNRDDASLAFIEVWAWAKLANELANAVVSGDYPNVEGLAEVVRADWEARIQTVARTLATWITRAHDPGPWHFQQVTVGGSNDPPKTP